VVFYSEVDMTTFKCNFWSGAGPAARALILFAKIGAVVVLAGCAVAVPARVTTFQEWPADTAGATWQFDSSTKQQDSLEYRNYADMIRSAMGPVGLVEAKNGQVPRFTVAFSYGMDPVQVVIEHPYDPYWGPYGYGGWGGRGRFRGGFGYGWGAPYPPTWSSTMVDASRSYLRVEIRDERRNHTKVYESTATNTGSGDSLPKVMPYLVRAIFDGFPDTNGQVREVSYMPGAVGR
jgi:hypothetical protein